MNGLEAIQRLAQLCQTFDGYFVIRSEGAPGVVIKFVANMRVGESAQRHSVDYSIGQHMIDNGNLGVEAIVFEELEHRCRKAFEMQRQMKQGKPGCTLP